MEIVKIQSLPNQQTLLIEITLNQSFQDYQTLPKVEMVQNQFFFKTTTSSQSENISFEDHHTLPKRKL